MTKGNEGNGGRSFGRLKNIANIGDIITVEGYELGIFQVESWTHEVDYQPDYIDETIIYDVTDMRNHQFLLAFQDDISVVCRADKADEYLRNLGIGNDIPKLDYGYMIDPVWAHIESMSSLREEAEAMANKPKEITKEERIDRLLDEINDYTV